VTSGVETVKGGGDLNGLHPYHGHNRLLLHALLYARRGWSVVPLFGIDENGCECRRDPCLSDPSKRGKHPRTLNGHDDATTDEADIRRWWGAWPTSNIGIRAGDGLVVIDVDPRHGGELTFEVLTAGREFPRTPTVCTGSGGQHYYFTSPNPMPRTGRDALGSGVDVKANAAGFVVAPPSLHYSGNRYRWLVYDAEPQPLPDHLVPLPRQTRTVDGRESLIPGTRHGRRYALAALRDECTRAAARVDGQGRRDGLFEAGPKLSRFIVSKDLRREDVASALAAAGEGSGLSRADAFSHACNGIDTGLAKGVA
jgi:hypothetical protein